MKFYVQCLMSNDGNQLLQIIRFKERCEGFFNGKTSKVLLQEIIQQSQEFFRSENGNLINV